MSLRIFSVLIALLAIGCDQVVGPDYLGRPLFVIEGTVIVDDSSDGDFDDKVDLALVWNGTGQDQVAARSFTTTRFPAVFQMALYEPPPERALVPIPGHRTAKYAVGYLFAFRDLDGDGIVELGEPLIGEAKNHVLTYFTEGGRSAVVTDQFVRGFTLKTLVACNERTDIWMVDAGTENVNLVFGGDLSLGDIDCDDQPDDPCLGLLRVLRDEESSAEEVNDAISNYEENGCYDQYGPIDCIGGECERCTDAPCDHPNSECQCPEEFCAGDPGCLCEHNQTSCACYGGECVELAPGCEDSGEPGLYWCNGCLVTDPSCGCESGICEACERGFCDACPRECLIDNGSVCDWECAQRVANNQIECDCGGCPDQMRCISNSCVPVAAEQMDCESACECPDGWQCRNRSCCQNC